MLAKAGIQKLLNPGFRLAVAIAGLAGMTTELFIGDITLDFTVALPDALRY